MRTLNGIQRALSRLFKRRAPNGARPDAHGDVDRRLVLRVAGRKVPSAKQLKHLPRYLSARERTILALLLVVACLSALGAATKYLGDHLVSVPSPGGDIVEASVGGPHLVNPVLATTNDADLDIAKLVFSGLVRTNERGEIVPDLAESYSVSDDGKSYVFTLREGVTWHDDVPFTARDVAATIGYVKDPAWRSPLFSQFKNVTVEANDDRTVTFTLAEPFAPFLAMMTLGILPEHLWQEVKPENAARAELNIKPVGTGPFKFKSFAKDKKGAIRAYSLARNDAYHGAKPNVESVTFKFYPDFAAAHDALTGRKVDGMSFLPLEFRDTVEKLRWVRSYTLRLPQYTGVFLNTKRNTLLRSKDVRQALAHAVDRGRILDETLGANGVPVYGPILAGFVGFHPDVKKYPFDLEAAAALLEKDGWKLGEDGVRTKKLTNENKETVDTQLALTLTTVDVKENITVAQLIKQSWESIGVKTELEIVPSSRIQKDKIRPRDYDALLYGEIIGQDPDPYPFWHSSQNEGSGLNLAVFSNRRVDEILEKARATTQDADREKLYKEFQDILAEEAPAIFLYSPTYTYAMSRKVKGVGNGTIFTPSDRFNGIADWYVETRREWR